MTFGVIVISLLLLALPFLMRGALRFRLRNTEYRGLRFDFTGSAGGAYQAYLPPMLAFLLPSALLAVDLTGKSTLYASLLYLGFPLMHGAMKGYQQRHLQFGSAGSTYSVPARRFFKPYLISTLFMIGTTVVVGVLAAVIIPMINGVGPKPAGASLWATVLPFVIGLIFGYFTYLLMGPYLQSRLGNLVWSNTAFPGIEIRSSMSARAFARLQTVNMLLTLLTLGLYRPFAVVRVYRFRLENLSLHSSAGFEQVVAAAAQQRRGAAGDAAADFFDLDLSW
jgi:uncharacterized membrane protein YjgN (DUF898 family)